MNLQTLIQYPEFSIYAIAMCGIAKRPARTHACATSKIDGSPPLHHSASADSVPAGSHRHRASSVPPVPASRARFPPVPARCRLGSCWCLLGAGSITAARSIIIDSPEINQHWLPRTPMAFNNAAIPGPPPQPQSLRVPRAASLKSQSAHHDDSMRFRQRPWNRLDRLHRISTSQSPTDAKFRIEPLKNTIQKWNVRVNYN